MFCLELLHAHSHEISSFSLQSETKLETKEESHLEEEGPSMSQEKLALP